MTPSHGHISSQGVYAILPPEREAEKARHAPGGGLARRLDATAPTLTSGYAGCHKRCRLNRNPNGFSTTELMIPSTVASDVSNALRRLPRDGIRVIEHRTTTSAP